MAVDFKDQKSNNQHHKSGAKQPRQEEVTSASDPRGRRVSPNLGISNRLSGYGSGGDVYERLYEAFNTKVKFLNLDDRYEEKYGVIKLLKDRAGLLYSGIVVTETLNNNTTAHILMVESTGEYPDKITENIGGMRYELLRTPADALDEKYVSQATAAVVDSLQVDASTVTVVDGTLVPNEFDVNSVQHVEDLIENVFNAIHSELAIQVEDYKGLNISELVASNPNGKFVVNTFFNAERSKYLDKTDMPVRQDVCVSLSYKTNQGGNNRSVNQGTDSYDIIKTYGYVDFEFTQAGPQMYGHQNTQRFIPNFVITGFDSKLAITPDKILMGIASVITLNEELRWLQAFRTHPRKGEVDNNDIGALNIEGNIEGSPSSFGKLYNTKSKEFTVVELNNLTQTLVHPNLIVSIDLPKAGPDTWITSIFKYIKFRKSEAAKLRLVESATTLTNGQFNPNVPVFEDISNRIHGGFYRSKDGFEDIRNLSSYLGVANHVNSTNQQPGIIAQYTDTLYNVSVPAEIRAAERGKLLEEMTAGTMVCKQFYDRVTFTNEFLSSLVYGLKNAGFNPIFNNMGASNDMFQRRSSFDFSGATLGQDLRITGQDNMFSGWGAGNLQYTRAW